MLKCLLCFLFFSQLCFAGQHQNNYCGCIESYRINIVREEIESLQIKCIEKFYSHELGDQKGSPQYYRLLGEIEAYGEVLKILEK